LPSFSNLGLKFSAGYADSRIDMQDIDMNWMTKNSGFLVAEFSDGTSPVKICGTLGWVPHKL
jgi:hypothetical protein